MRKAKRFADLSLAHNCNGNSKQFFSYYKCNKQKSGIGPRRNDGVTFKKDAYTITLLSKHFTSVFTPGAPIPSNMGLGDATPTANIGDPESNLQIVRKNLSSIGSNNSAGPDVILTRILRQTKDQLAHPFILIFRRSIEFSEVPDDWRRANAVPIFKVS